MTRIRKTCTHSRHSRWLVALVSAATVGCLADTKLGTAPDASLQISRLVLTPERVATGPSGQVVFDVVGLTASGDTAPISVVWAAKRGTVAGASGVDPSGRGKGKKVGHYKADNTTGQDTVIVDDTSGVADTAIVDVEPDVVAAVDVAPATAALAVGAAVQLTATPRDSAGNALTGRQVLWSTSDGDVATVSSSGLVTGASAGSATITATSEGQSGTATVTVTNVPAASVTVSPAAPSIEVGQTVQLTATVRDADGNTLTGRAVAWSSSATAVATVSGSGLVTGVLQGSATITATSEGKSGTAAVSVTAPPPPPPPGGALAAFPGAQGFGATTSAGRGGTIHKVTNLNDGGSGSLRAALSASGPRVVIFEVSGTIRIGSDLVISNPFVTVAGQTAPSPGITLRGAALRVNTHDVLVQHLRIRVGDDPSGPSPGGRDGLQIYGSTVYNVVIDHVSTSWGIDENASTSTSGNRHDITISNSIISEGLSNSFHDEGEHSKGLLVGEGTKELAVIGTIFAHNRDRNPYVKGDTRVLFVNNVAYNCGSECTFLADPGGDGLQSGTIIGNVYRNGRDTPSGDRPIRIGSNLKPGSLVYLADNAFWGQPAPSDPYDPALVRNEHSSSAIKASSPPVWVQPLTVRPVGQVADWVLANAGARPAERDAVDARIVNEVRAGTGGIIDSQNEVGGWPTLAVNQRTLTPPGNPNGDDDGDGYTNLEEWLHQFAREVEGR